MRFVAVYQADKEQREDFMRAGIRMSLAGTAVTAVVAAIAAPHLPGVAVVSAETMLAVLVFMLPFQVFASNTDMYYLAVSSVRPQLWLISASIVTYGGLLYLTWLWRLDGWFYGKFLLPGVLGLVLMKIHQSWLKKPICRDTYKRLIKYGWPLWFAGFADVIFISIDSLILAAVLRDANVIGYYGIASLFFVSCQQMFKPVQRIFVPKIGGEESLSRYRSTLSQYAWITGGTAVLLCTGGWLIAPWFIQPIFGSSFAPAEPLVRMIAFAILARGVALYTRTIMQLHGDTAPIMVITIIAAVVDIALNLIFIKAVGVMGAVYTVVAVHTLIAACCLGWTLHRGLLDRPIERAT